MKKDLKDTPFSIDRLFVWALAITLLVAMIGMVVLAYQGREIPPQIQSVVMFILGVFARSIAERYLKDSDK